jgi:hypothetical protein
MRQPRSQPDRAIIVGANRVPHRGCDFCSGWQAPKMRTSAVKARDAQLQW